jgi:serine/threonine protein kinase
VVGRADALKHYGTPPYVAPEQVAGQAVDARADVYALGHMIAEVWGGKLPSHSALGLLWHKDAPDAMPRVLGELVGDMLEADPARRLSDLGAVAEALRAQSQQMTSAQA